MIRAVVSDIGGVLIRTENHSGRIKLEQQYHLPSGGADTIVFNSPPARASTIGLEPDQAVWDYVAKTLSLSKTDLDRFQNQFWSGDELDQALLDFFQGLRPDYITALLSNAWMNFRLVLERDFGIIEGKTVDHLLISSELGIAKPNPEIFQVLSNRLEIDFQQILFIDDFIENIEAAKELGIQTIHYQKGLDLINEIKLRLFQ